MIRNALLIGDLGATNARFALANPGGPGYSNELSLKCSDHASPVAAIEHYLQHCGVSHLSAICLAVAAPVVSDEIRFINNDWRFSGDELREKFSISRVKIVNDFKAAAFSIPLLGPEDLLTVGDAAIRLVPENDYSVGLIGPGTGLGISGLLQEKGRQMAVSGEGGHQGFSPHSELQNRVFEKVSKRFGRTSAERLVSGQGIENIYRAILEIHGQPATELNAAQVMQRAVEGSDDAAATTEMLFYEIMGQVAGDLALLIGAYDGVLIGGGIVQRYPDRLLDSGFRQGFENKGRHSDLMKNIPTCLITHPNPGLLGASNLVQFS